MKSLSIKNYKNLRDLKIDSLSKVNLIVGMNNSGKSTLLEAISIYIADGGRYELIHILENRGLRIMNSQWSTGIKSDVAFDNFSTLYSDQNIGFPIQISSDTGTTISIRIVDIMQEKIINEAGETILREKVVSEDDIQDNYIRNKHRGFEVLKDEIQQYVHLFAHHEGYIIFRKRVGCRFVDSSPKNNSDNYKYYSAISMTDREEYLLDALRIIEPRIEAINFLKDDLLNDKDMQPVPFVVYYGEAEKRRLSVMGDGINRILTIALAMLNCENATLLIDEFDNGLHYSVQTKLWEAVYFLAEKLNVQVFATTHSDDCIKSFIEADKNSDGKLIRLENRGGDIVAVSYEDKDELEYIATSNIEIR